MCLRLQCVPIAREETDSSDFVDSAEGLRLIIDLHYYCHFIICCVIDIFSERLPFVLLMMQIKKKMKTIQGC